MFLIAYPLFFYRDLHSYINDNYVSDDATEQRRRKHEFCCPGAYGFALSDLNVDHHFIDVIIIL